jgi:hypothetical protein
LSKTDEEKHDLALILHQTHKNLHHAIQEQIDCIVISACICCVWRGIQSEITFWKGGITLQWQDLALSYIHWTFLQPTRS